MIIIRPKIEYKSPRTLNMHQYSSITMHEALNLWRDIVIRGLQNNAYDLSTRQTGILLTAYLSPPPHTIKSLSELMLISKPAVCRAVDTLSKLGLIKRKRDEKDKRIVYIQRTVKGSVYLSEFGEIIHAVSQRSEVMDRITA